MQIDELTDKFFAWNGRNRPPATVAFYRARLKKFCEAYNARDLASLTPLEIDEHLDAAGTGMSDSTRHHDAVALERLQKFAIQNKLLDKPVFGNLEKPRVGRRDRVPTATETEVILSRASPAFRLIYSALRQCGARPGELCRATIPDVDRVSRVITLKEHKTVRKTGQARRIPIGRKLSEMLDLAIGDRTEGPVFLSPIARSSISESFRPMGMRRACPVLRTVLCSFRVMTRLTRSTSGIVARQSSPGRAPHCRSAE